MREKTKQTRIDSFISNDVDTGKDIVVNTRNNNKILACSLKSEFKINRNEIVLRKKTCLIISERTLPNFSGKNTVMELRYSQRDVNDINTKLKTIIMEAAGKTDKRNRNGNRQELFNPPLELRKSRKKKCEREI